MVQHCLTHDITTRHSKGRTDAETKRAPQTGVHKYNNMCNTASAI